MDIKKPDSPLFSGGTPSISKQTSASQNHTNPQLGQNNIKLDNIGQIKIGQQIDLRVVKIMESEAILDIIGTKLRVHTADKELLQIGQQLKAQITSTQPMIQLKVLSQPTAAQFIINSTLRQIMPIQQSLKDLLGNIQLLTKNSSVEYSAALHNTAIRFSQSLPPIEAYKEADILPEILKKSGLFTEHLLAKHLKDTSHQHTFPNNDLRIALLRLADQLRSLPTETNATNKPAMVNPILKNPDSLKENIISKTHTNKKNQLQSSTKQNSAASKALLLQHEHIIDKLLSQTEGVLARLQTLQLQHAQSDEQHRPTWSFELPIRTNTALDNIQIYIEQDDENTNNKNYSKPWKVILKFNIKELGAIQAHVTLQDSKVSVNFWTENKQTATLFSEYFNLLTTQFDKAGLETGLLKCRCDKAPKQAAHPYVPLIDETT